jgi:hypothetical protein
MVGLEQAVHVAKQAPTSVFFRSMVKMVLSRIIWELET